MSPAATTTDEPPIPEGPAPDCARPPSSVPSTSVSRPTGPRPPPPSGVAGGWHRRCSSSRDLPPEQVGPFLGSLTPVTLRTDTAVTNHGFRDGSATAFQSVLQAGTGVLVDAQGLPRVRCYCGNPLGEKKVSEFVVVDPGTDEVVTWPVGTSGKDDRPADPGVTQCVRKRALYARGGGGATAGAPSTAAGVDGHAGGGAADQNTVAPDAGEQPDASTAAVSGGERSPQTSAPGTGPVVDAMVEPTG